MGVIEIELDKGCPSDFRKVFHGEGDHEPGKEPGDIIIQMEEKEHEVFQRHGRDLAMKLDIDVYESLCGMKRAVKTLFNITFPEKLDPSVAKKLSSLLPKPKLPPVPAGAEDVHLEVFDGEATWGGEQTKQEDDYEDASFEGGPGMQGGPQCKQM